MSDHPDARPGKVLQFAFATLLYSLGSVLAIFTLRRVLFAFTILSRSSARSAAASSCRPAWPDVLVLAACRDEAPMIDSLSNALTSLDYPSERIRVVLIDDGSTDGTAARMEQWAASRSGWSVLRLPVSAGKATALNAGLASCAFGEIVYVLDADHRPSLQALKRIVGYFDEPFVAGVSGRTIARNLLASPVAYYSGVEADVHQLVTMRAKDRLHLGPALLGSNCAYRRQALAACGNFREGALLEDYDLTLAFYRAGLRVRFADDAVSVHEVPETMSAYTKQHTRWGRGFYDVAHDHLPSIIASSRLSLVQKLELTLFLAGYLDRLVLVGLVALTVLTSTGARFSKTGPIAMTLIALLTPFAQVAALFVEQRASAAMWVRLPLLALFLTLDVLAAMRAAADAAFNRPRIWAKTIRSAT